MARVTLVALLLTASLASAQPLPPELTAPVNDFADVIDARSTAEIETLIRQLQAASGDVIVVATVRTFKPYADLQSYAVEMFENHGKGIGTRKGDNGALIVLAVDDRQVRIEVGYGLEGFVTDGFAGETSRDTMVPYFRRGEYGPGLLAGATRVAQRIADGRHVTIEVASPRPAPRPGADLRINPITILVVLYILYRLMKSSGSAAGVRRRRGRHWTSGAGPFGVGGGWGGGGWGGGGSWGGSSGGFGGFGGGRSGGGGGGASW
jgi:uncharacterized protein